MRCVAAWLLFPALAGFSAACGLFTSLNGLSDTEEAVDAAVPRSTDGGSILSPDAAVPVPVPEGDAAPIEGPGAAYRAIVVADAPLALFGLEETNGNGCASFVAGGAATCVCPASQATRGVPGIAGTKALHLDAEVAALGISGVTGDFTKPYTIELWLKEDTITAGASIARCESAALPRNGMHVFVDANKKLRLELWGNGALLTYGVTAADLTPAVWHHVAVVHQTSPDKELLYVDGSLQEGTSQVGARPSIDAAFSVSGFTGSVDELAFYDKAVTGARVAAHYAGN